MKPQLYSDALGIFPVNVAEGSIFVNPKTKIKYRLVNNEWIEIKESQ